MQGINSSTDLAISAFCMKVFISHLYSSSISYSPSAQLIPTGWNLIYKPTAPTYFSVIATRLYLLICVTAAWWRSPFLPSVMRTLIWLRHIFLHTLPQHTIIIYVAHHSMMEGIKLFQRRYSVVKCIYSFFSDDPQVICILIEWCIVLSKHCSEAIWLMTIMSCL